MLENFEEKKPLAQKVLFCTSQSKLVNLSSFWKGIFPTFEDNKSQKKTLLPQANFIHNFPSFQHGNLISDVTL